MEKFSVLLAISAGIHQSPVNSPHKGQWREALMFSLICSWLNTWVNNCEAGDLRRHRAHYDVIVMHTEKEATICLNHGNKQFSIPISKIHASKMRFMYENGF